MKLLNPRSGHSRDSEVKKIIIEVDGNFFAQRIALCCLGMRALQLQAAGDFVVVGNRKMNALKANIRRAGGLGQQNIFDVEWRAVVNVGIVQVLNAGQPECRLQQAAKGTHEAQLDHLIEKTHVFNRVMGVVVRRNHAAELPRRMRARAVGIVFDCPVFRSRHTQLSPLLCLAERLESG